MVHGHLANLQAIGQIEACVRDITALEKFLDAVAMWQPAAALSRQAAEARRIIAATQARLDRRLVVTLIGPSGAGKSTLLNALAGVDDLSPTGTRRPTTKELIVLSNDTESANRLLDNPGESGFQIKTSKAAALDHMILVDTPDTDSTQAESHVELLKAAITRSDVLICVFDAQNPKRRDHADFMAPLVQRFHGASLIAVVNKCDRLSEKELKEDIGPDFAAYLEQAWQTTPMAFLFVAARRHLQEPDWDSQAMPRHDLDQFDRLRELVLDTFNQPGFTQDRRVANARQLRDFVSAQVQQAAQRDEAQLKQALDKMAAAEKEALQQALETMRGQDRRQIVGVHVRLYQAMAQRWMGPVGWLVAIWSRLIVFGSGLTALVRFGHPLRQIWGLFSAWRQFKDIRAALAALQDRGRVDAALQAYRKSLLAHWPDVAETLIRGRFDAAVRQVNDSAGEQVGRNLESLWSDVLDTEIERSAAGLSRLLLQFCFNLPALALMGYVGWLTAQRFISARYLTSDFFLHALLTLALVLLLSFFLLQVIVRIAISRDRIQRRAFAFVEKTIARHPMASTRPLAEQVESIIRLAGDKSSSPME